VGPRADLDRCGKISPPTEIRSPDRPARSQSLYRLRYSAHKFQIEVSENKVLILSPSKSTDAGSVDPRLRTAAI